MKLVVISSPNKTKSEIGYISEFLNAGCDVFHVKKKKITKKQMVEYLKLIPKEYRNRIVLHSHYSLASKFGLKGIHISSHKKHTSFWAELQFKLARIFNKKLTLSKSFHSIQSLINDKSNYEYVFLSPVFDKYDIQDFSAAYSEKQLRSCLFKSKHKVIALGGVSISKIEHVRRVGFFGAAIHSAIWREENNRVQLLKEVITEIKRVVAVIN